MSHPTTIAIDTGGNAWVANDSFGISKFNDGGSPLSGQTGYTYPGFHGGSAVAIDNEGNAWVSDPGGYAAVSKLSPTGMILSGTGYTGGGIVPGGGGYTMVLDGGGNVWVPLYSGSGVAELSKSGSVLSGMTGCSGGVLRFPYAVAIDGSGDLWVSSETPYSRGSAATFQVTELIGVAVPVVTPLAAGVKYGTLASRP